MNTKYLSYALLLGMLFSFSGQALYGQRKQASLDMGITYMEADQRALFTEDSKDIRRTAIDMDESVGLDDSDREFFWIFVDYKEGQTGLWGEYLYYDDSGSADTNGRFFGQQIFSGNVKTDYELTILQAVFYESGEFGDVGVGLTGVRQEVTLARFNRHSERLDLPMATVRWRYHAPLDKDFYLQAEAQYMSAVEKAEGHDMQAEMGYIFRFKGKNNRVDKESFRLAAGYREFKVKGDVSDGEIDLRIKGPYVKLTLSTSF